MTVGLWWDLEVVDRGAWGTVRGELEQEGGSREACPEVGVSF